MMEYPMDWRVLPVKLVYSCSSALGCFPFIPTVQNTSFGQLVALIYIPVVPQDRRYYIYVLERMLMIQHGAQYKYT